MNKPECASFAPLGIEYYDHALFGAVHYTELHHERRSP
jgi:hypothetical protein